MNMHTHPAPERGMALLSAMLTVALVTFLAAGALWQQWRTFEVESAERQRQQAAWLLNGAMDWARLVLREDGKSSPSDHLGEPWALPLREARLSSFLSSHRLNCWHWWKACVKAAPQPRAPRSTQLYRRNA